MVDFQRPGGEDFERRLPAMVRSLHHRGPDQSGVHYEPHAALGHTRLSIIDLSDAGRQPMCNEDGTVWVSFNGEIYNFRELQQELQDAGHRFRSRSDTEVILHLYEQEGIDCIRHFRGMFAFAIWDSRKRMLFLGRDQLGIKPLYYAVIRGRLIFGSEIKAILAHGDVPRAVRADAFSDYLSFLYVPAPKTMFREVFKLESGCWLTYDASGLRQGRYWDLEPPHPLEESRVAAEGQIVHRLGESVAMQMVSDVPLGAFLSGGVDSSSVVAMMRQVGGGPVVTASVGFEEKEYDELPHARRVADRYRTDHFEQIVRPDAAAAVEKLAWHYDEPFADYSSIPTYYVSRAARQHVTVALSGDGGDENFAGYSRYRWALREQRLRRLVPSAVRQWLVGPLARMYPPDGWMPRPLRAKATLASIATDYVSAYLATVFTLTDEQKEPFLTADVLSSLGGYRSADIIRGHMRASGRSGLNQLLYTEIKTYLVDDILTKVDRASMAVSLEVRVPLLDHLFVEYAHRIPATWKIQGRQGKCIFKSAMRPFLDDETLYRRKQGFHPPVGNWLRGPLRAMAGDLLLSPRAAIGEYVRPQALRRVWEDHQSLRKNNVTLLWTLLMFELWAGKFLHE